jgi:transposase InsO family protein
VVTTRLSGGKGGRNDFEAELRRLGITQKDSRPNHPTTCAKVERFHQTLKRWLTAQNNQPPPSATCKGSARAKPRQPR